MRYDPRSDSPFAGPAGWGEPVSEADYARGRRGDRTYLSKSFPVRAPSRDAGHPGRFVHKVFGGHECERDMTLDWSEEIVVEGTRRQIRLLIAREAGKVKEIRLWRVPNNGDIDELLHLDRTESQRLVNLIKAVDHIPVEGDTATRIDDDLIRDLLADPEGMRTAYSREPSKFADLIIEDVTASDVIAIASRRAQVEIFRRLLNEPDYFAERQSATPTLGPEGVWQAFIEANSWILGLGLAGQLLTSWNPSKLEQVVAGANIAGGGKRVDALLRTAGAVSSMVFAEIKNHKTPLLGGRDSYRTDCWPPSRELSGGVTQIQQTVYLAREQIGERMVGRDAEGFEDGSVTFMIRPRCYLIAGHLGQLTREGSVHLAKLRSFELFRRNLHEPEIITFDELLARAEWHLAKAERDLEQRS